MKATQISAIKEELAEKAMTKAVSYFAKLRLKLPLGQNSLLLLRKPTQVCTDD